MNMMLVLAIYVVAIVAYVAFSRRRQAKAQEDRFAGLAKGAEVETIGGLIAIVDEIDKENNRIVLDAEGVFLTFDLSRSIMKVITPAPTTETAETTKKTIIEEDSAIESADENVRCVFETRLNPGLFAFSNLIGIKSCSEPLKMW